METQWTMIAEALGLGPDSLADSFRRLAVRELRDAADLVEEGEDADEKLGRAADLLLLVDMFETEARARLVVEAAEAEVAAETDPRAVQSEATDPPDTEGSVSAATSVPHPSAGSVRNA